MVRKLTGLCFGLLCVLLVLTGCVAKVGPVCFGSDPGGPPQVTQGPVTITLDRTIYDPSDSINMTITNTLDATIYIRSALGCPTLLLRRIVDGEWHAIGLCRITEAAPSARAYSIAAHGSGGDGLTLSGQPATIPDGTYRVGLPYSTHVPPGDPRAGMLYGVTVWSQAFQICTCRSC